MRPKYQQAIDAILNADAPKEAMKRAWESPFAREGEGGALFQMATRNFGDCFSAYVARIGCLTDIKNSTRYSACTPEFTEQIRNDPRIPCDINEIVPSQETLAPFGEWQTKIDDYYESLQEKAVTV